MKITAVIPIRKGSQRVKNKNLRPFAGKTLLEVKIESLSKSKLINEIIVNTDSDDAIEIVKRMKKYVNNLSFQEREPYFASSECTGSEFFEYLGRATQTDVFVYAPCTSPFVKAGTYDACIQKFLESKNSDCVATVSPIKEFLWLKGKPLNYNPKNAPNSQNLPDIFALNFATTVTTTENLKKFRNIIGQKPNFVSIDEIEAIDIDTPLDFEFAEFLYRKFNGGGYNCRVKFHAKFSLPAMEAAA